MNLKFKQKIRRQWLKHRMLRDMKNMREQYDADREMRIHYSLQGNHREIKPMAIPTWNDAPRNPEEK